MLHFATVPEIYEPYSIVSSGFEITPENIGLFVIWVYLPFKLWNPCNMQYFHTFTPSILSQISFQFKKNLQISFFFCFKKMAKILKSQVFPGILAKKPQIPGFPRILA